MMDARMVEIRVAPELWGASILPQGILQRWLQPDGTLVEAGEAVACVQIEDSRHDLLAPVAGWLKAECPVNGVIEPGMVIGHMDLP
jgi:hypothetical protein